VTVGVNVKAAGRWWNSFMHPSDGGFFFFFALFVYWKDKWEPCGS